LATIRFFKLSSFSGDIQIARFFCLEFAADYFASLVRAREIAA
jgi:ribosomal protein S3AE